MCSDVFKSAYFLGKYNYGFQYLVDGEYRMADYFPFMSIEKVKNTIYRGLEKKEDKKIEINQESEDKTDSSESK
jgi:hypothetical protein